MVDVSQNMQQIAIACVHECERQRVGLDALGKLLEAYAWAAERADAPPSEADATELWRLVIGQRSDGRAYRATPVTFAGGGSAVHHAEIAGAMARLFARLERDTPADAFVRAFLDIHPFGDGNGRVAFVLYNWLRGSFAQPLALPRVLRGV